MTLVVAVVTESGTWMGGERVAGDFDYNELAGPKIFELAWEQTTRGYVANGGARETFSGAYEVLRRDQDDPVEAARAAWPIAQRRHRIGPLVDEIVIPL